MPVSTAPAFKPNQPPVALAAGVLTSAGPTGPLSFAAASGGAGLANRYTFASAAGANNNVAPTGSPAFPSTQSFRIIATAGSGAANWTGLAAGVDGQLGLIYNNDAANNITLNNLNAGSGAANQFAGRNGNDAIIPAKSGLLVVYDSALTKWIMI